VTEFVAEGAENLKKYFAVTEEGYGFVHISNKEAEASYFEQVVFNKFDKLTMLKPFKGTGYDVTVQPGTSRTVVFRQDDPTGFSLASQLMQSRVNHGKEKLKQLAVTKGIEKCRVHPQTKKELEIY